MISLDAGNGWICFRSDLKNQANAAIESTKASDLADGRIGWRRRCGRGGNEQASFRIVLFLPTPLRAPFRETSKKHSTRFCAETTPKKVNSTEKKSTRRHIFCNVFYFALFFILLWRAKWHSASNAVTRRGSDEGRTKQLKYRLPFRFSLSERDRTKPVWVRMTATVSWVIAIAITLKFKGLAWWQ